MTRRAAFAALHQGSAAFLLPNCWDVASAVLLVDAGFAAIGTTSLGITAGAGMPDGSAAGRELTVALAESLAPRLPVPLSVDLEGGYSNDPEQVADLAARLADAGVAGVNLEDGTASGALRTVSEHSAIVRAVRTAAPGLFINARTDVYWLQVGAASGRHADAAYRLSAYRDAGASGVFAPGLSDLAVMEFLAAQTAAPLNVLWQPGVSLTQLGAVGVARVSTGSALYRHAMGAAIAAAAAARDGTAPTTEPVDYTRLQDQLHAHDLRTP